MKFLLLFFLLPLKLFSQDIAGVWKGTLYNDTTKQYLKYELAISENNEKLSGYSYTIFVIDSIENIGVKSIKIKKSGNHFFIEDEKLIYNNYNAPPAKGVKMYSDLLLSEGDTNLILKGPWKTNRTKIYQSITGNIVLHRKKNIYETLIIPKLIDLGLAQNLSFMTYETDLKNIASNNKSLSAQPLNKEPEENIQKDKLLADNSPINLNDKKEFKDSARQVITTPSTIKKDTINDKNPSYARVPVRDSVVHKKDDSTFLKNSIAASDVQKKINKNDRQILPQTSEVVKTAPTKKEPPKDSSINSQVDRITTKETSDQIVSAKNIFNNNETVHANIRPAFKPAAEIASREIETVKSVDIKNDSLLLTLYDNGEIDGDTVSVLLNGKVIMPMQGLTAKGISKTIYLTPEMGDSIKLIMYAENLGSIPPNTGLLVVHDGDQIYEIRFSGDLQKNSAIILKRKRKH